MTGCAISNSPQISRAVAHQNGNDPIRPVTLNVDRHNPDHVLRVVPAQQEQGNEHHSRDGEVNQMIRFGLQREILINFTFSKSHPTATHPSDPRRGQAAQHGERVKGQKTGDGDKKVLGNEEILAVLLDVRMDRGEDGERHEEDEEDVEELRGSLLHNLPVRGSGLGLLLISIGQCSGLLLQQLVVAVEFL